MLAGDVLAPSPAGLQFSSFAIPGLNSSGSLGGMLRHFRAEQCFLDAD